MDEQEYFLLISCKSMQKKQAFEMTTPKEGHQSDREWIGSATPLFEKKAEDKEPINKGEKYMIADHLQDRFLPKEDSTDIEKEKSKPANLLREQVDAGSADLFTEQVDAPSADLFTEQVDAGPVDLLTEQVNERATDLLTEQIDEWEADLLTEQVEPLKALSATQWRIVALCEIPRTLAEITTEIGVGSRYYFKTRHLDPLIKGNVIKMTNPDKPRASNQKYVLIETGIQLKINKPKGKS